MARLLTSLAAYLDYVVVDNHEGYSPSSKAPRRGQRDPAREIYEEARSSLNGRIFREDAQGTIIPETPATRLVVRGWSAMVEELVLSWVADPGPVTREELLEVMAASLPALVEVVPGRRLA